MKTNIEKQVAAFDQVLGHCNALGPVYNPSKESMKVAALTTLLTSAQKSIQAVDTAKSAYIQAVNERQKAFAPLPGSATRIVNALGATDASPQLIADIKLYRDKFRSVARESQPKTNMPEGGSQDQPNSASTSRGPVSQLDFESKIRNFNTMIELLKSEPTYKPNEADLTIAALTATLAILRAKHKAVMTAQMTLSNARLERNKVVYSDSGIYGTGKRIKRYILSVYGATSAQYRQIDSFYFKKV
jgi:hypothetical protein